MTAYNFSLLNPDAMNAPRYEPGKLYFVEFDYVTGTTTFANTDTITTPAGALPNNGITIADVEVISNALDTNATPTATYSVGDANLSNRFISSANAGNAISGAQVKNYINIAQVLTAGVVTSGPNYIYVQGSAPQLVLTFTNNFATANTSPIIRMKVWYWCTGNAA